MAKIDLPYGDGTLSFTIKDPLLGEVLRPKAIPSVPDFGLAVIWALNHPLGTQPLRQLVRGRRRVAIIIDDNTRKTPTKRILQLLLHELRRAGLENEDIRIIVALGTHRPMTADEISFKIGEDIAGHYDVVNSSSEKESQVRYLGKSSAGIPAWVNRAVFEADFRIGVGMITPHMDTGFSGGAKIILPGVCSHRTVEAFHSRLIETHSTQLGMTNSHLRKDLEAFVKERIRLHFILNVILNHDGRLYQCVAGDFIQAHRAGVKFAEQVYGVQVKRRYPLVISNAFPFDQDLWQSTKGIASGEMVAEDGGTLILVARCKERNEMHPLFAEYIGCDHKALKQRLDTSKAEDPVACALAVPIAKIKQRIKIGLVSEGINSDVARQLGFRYYQTVEDSIREGLKDRDMEGYVAVLTHGGVTMPILQTK